MTKPEAAGQADHWPRGVYPLPRTDGERRPVEVHRGRHHAAWRMTRSARTAFRDGSRRRPWPAAAAWIRCRPSAPRMSTPAWQDTRTRNRMVRAADPARVPAPGTGPERPGVLGAPPEPYPPPPGSGAAAARRVLRDRRREARTGHCRCTRPPAGCGWRPALARAAIRARSVPGRRAPRRRRAAPATACRATCCWVSWPGLGPLGVRPATPGRPSCDELAQRRGVGPAQRLDRGEPLGEVAGVGRGQDRLQLGVRALHVDRPRQRADVGLRLALRGLGDEELLLRPGRCRTGRGGSRSCGGCGGPCPLQHGARRRGRLPRAARAGPGWCAGSQRPGSPPGSPRRRRPSPRLWAAPGRRPAPALLRRRP